MLVFMCFVYEAFLEGGWQISNRFNLLILEERMKLWIPVVVFLQDGVKEFLIVCRYMKDCSWTTFGLRKGQRRAKTMENNFLFHVDFK